jgi:hypothetical protein
MWTWISTLVHLPCLRHLADLPTLVLLIEELNIGDKSETHTFTVKPSLSLPCTNKPGKSRYITCLITCLETLNFTQ